MRLPHISCVPFCWPPQLKSLPVIVHFGTVCATLKILKFISSREYFASDFQGGVGKSKMIPLLPTGIWPFTMKLVSLLQQGPNGRKLTVIPRVAIKCFKQFTCMFHRRKHGGQTTSISAICCAVFLLNISLLLIWMPPCSCKLLPSFQCDFPFLSFHGFLWPYNAKQIYCKQS